MTLQQLRVLVAVAEHRSFTRGAQALFLTQSAASQHVRALEGELRTVLVQRLGGEVVPTRAGEALLRYAREMLRVAADAERFVSALRDGKAGRLVVGASGSAVYLVPSLVAGFRGACPDVEVSLQVQPRAALREALAQGAVDVALMSGPVREPGIDATLLCEDRLTLVAPPASSLLPAASLAPYPLERLAGHPLIAPVEPSASWRLVERWAAERGVELRPTFRMDGIDAIKKAVEAGIGAAFLSAWVVEREVALGTLRLVPLEPVAPARRFELLRLHDRYLESPLAQFLRFAPGFLAGRLPAALGPAPQPWNGAPGVVHTQVA